MRESSEELQEKKEKINQIKEELKTKQNEIRAMNVKLITILFSSIFLVVICLSYITIKLYK
jgi:hypothetical protein